MNELIIRQVPGYGFLPIVRDFDLTNGLVIDEFYRGDFYRTAKEAAEAGIRHLEEATQCRA